MIRNAGKLCILKNLVLHKLQGASVVLYRSAELRRYQIFAYAEWPGGLFGSPSMAGSRPGRCQ